MAAWHSITKKAEDATLAAFIAIAGTDATDIPVTWEIGGDADEINAPHIAIYSPGHEVLAPDAGICARNTFDVEMVAEVRTGEGTTRVQHSALVGLAEAVGNQSADQMVTELNAAGVANFNATRWKFLRQTNDYSGQRRITSLYFSLICNHT